MCSLSLAEIGQSRTYRRLDCLFLDILANTTSTSLVPRTMPAIHRAPCLRLHTLRGTILKPVSSRAASTQSRRPPIRDETTLGGAQHKPSLGGPSLGHLISELSATTPEMIKQGLRKEGHTMAEDQRTFARRITIAVMGVPVVIGTGIVGFNWLFG